jgi:hypothetical protein
MTADSRGNDISAVGIPVTGSIGIAAIGTTLPTPAEGGSEDYVLPAAFRRLGLITEDGGFSWTFEPDGDPITFYQEGYSIPSGLANATLEVKLAQYDDLVREVTYGRQADANGYIEIDAGGHSTRYVLFTEEIFKNGAIRRIIAADAGVTSATRDQSTRGEVNGTALTFTIARHESLGRRHVGEWWLPAEDAAPVTP